MAVQNSINQNTYNLDSGSLIGNTVTLGGDATITTTAISGTSLKIASPYTFSALSSTLDMTVMGASVNVYTVPAGKSFIPINLIWLITSASGVIAGPALDFGPSPSYNNLFTGNSPGLVDALPALYYSQAFQTFPASGMISPLPAGTVLGVIVDIAANATTYAGAFYLSGFLV